MAAKLLHSLTDENPDLQKQIGCMTGIFQLFDRQPIFIGKSVVDHAPPRPLHIGNSIDNTRLRSASREKQIRVSTESSRPSSSSSRSSSFSSLDCNRAAVHFEPSSYDRITFPETPSRDPGMSLDIRDFVKDSMHRDKSRVELSDLNESLKALSKLREAPWYRNEPRELLRSESYHMREVPNSFSASRDVAPRLSYDGRETRDVSKSTLVKLKDMPRLSLDSRESFVISQQTRPPSVVAKLMGLETLPDSTPSSSDSNSVNIMSAKTDGNSRKEPSSPRWRNSEPLTNPVLRFPIEPAPWKHVEKRAPAKASKSFPSVYSEIEKRLKDLEFTQSGKDLRALKQILEAMQSKEVRGSNSNKKPIVIMKPAESVINPISRKNDRTIKTAQTPSRLAKDDGKKNSGSISPRMQQRKLELEKKSRPPNPAKSSRQQNKLQSESNSPGGRQRPKQTADVSADSRYRNHRENERCVQSDKTVMGTSEVESGEFLSPVSVLDKVDVCKDDSPSPVTYLRGSPVYNFIPNTTESDSPSERSRKKLQSIDNLVQKLRRLNSTHDESHTDYIASLCENTNPDRRYISEILLASGLLLRELGSSLEEFQFHPSGYPINPELFLVLEQTKAEHSPERTAHRKLVFDTVNEILARKLGSKQLRKRAVNAQKLLKDLCSEIEFRDKNPRFGFGDREEEDGWKDILCEDETNQSESWKTFDDAICGAVLDIERSIFKDLVNDVVVGESAVGVKTSKKPGGRRRLFVKK